LLPRQTASEKVKSGILTEIECLELPPVPQLPYGVALLPIYPSRVFISWRKVLTRGHPPLVEADKMRSIRKLLHWELVGVVAIILCAALMARGFG
jgi:hypothetical protein